MESLVELTGVTKTYGSSPQPALSGVALRIASGELTAIMGRLQPGGGGAAGGVSDSHLYAPLETDQAEVADFCPIRLSTLRV